MISEYLNHEFVLAEFQTQHGYLSRLLKDFDAGVPRAIQAMKLQKLTRAQVDQAVTAMARSLAWAKANTDPHEGAYIASDRLLCAHQAEWSRQAVAAGEVLPVAPKPRRTTGVRKMVASAGADDPAAANDTSPQLKLARAQAHPSIRKAAGDFVEYGDIHYGVTGFLAKTGSLFQRVRKFNHQPARPAVTKRPLRLYVFGDWGTGLPLAKKVADSIRTQIEASDTSRQQHVVHLGDVYYVGEPYEYNERVFDLWPVADPRKATVGSWSLNGNHDMYSGGYGYFDTLLEEPRFRLWHADAKGKPSSFFLLEDPDWQVFGLDTAWNVPSFYEGLLTNATVDEWCGQNGLLTESQVEWMKKARNPAKGCVLLTHHQAAASRTTEKQHSDQAVELLQQAGLYDGIDAWIWGHEHRAVVFKPKSQRTDPRLKGAPEFCACLGHGGVPVTAKNFDLDNRKPDVLWDEDCLDDTAPKYEGKRVVPFGFGRLDFNPEGIDFRIFNHDGQERRAQPVLRKG